MPGAKLPPVPGLPDVRVDLAEIRDKARWRYETDAEFHYRVKATSRTLAAGLEEMAPSFALIAVVLELDERLRKESDLR